MARLRHGFVKQATLIAREEREEMGLVSHDPLNPWQLASNHGVPVVGLDNLEDERLADAFADERQAVFSAVTVPYGNGCLIIENTHHTPARRVANVTHEMAHVLLEHPFHDSILACDARGTTSVVEQEADRLMMELLVPLEAALSCARGSMPDEQIAVRFGVSVDMARMCMNRSGARKRAQHERRARSRR